MASPRGARAAPQPCKLFVGGLSAQTTTEALRLHFQRYGRLVDAVVMTKNGRPRGFGFVTFETSAGASGAMSEAQWLDGRMVDVKRAVPGEHPQERTSNKIFVGGLPQDATTEDLRLCFASYGPVADAVVMVDRRTKRSRGFGFVRFANGSQGSAAAEAVLSDAASHRMGGKWIEVKRATPAALMRDLSPCSSSKTSSTGTPPTGPAMEPAGLRKRSQKQGQSQQQQMEEAYWECFAAFGELAGLDPVWGFAEQCGQAVAPRSGRRGRRSRRRTSSATADLGGDAELAAFALAGELGDCDAATAGAYAEMMAGAWAAQAALASGPEFADALDWFRSGGFDAAVLSAWSGLDAQTLAAGLAAGEGGEDTAEEAGGAGDAALADDEPESPAGRGGGMAPPPGLGVGAAVSLSPMKVRCVPPPGGLAPFAGCSLEDALNADLQPWLSAH